MKTVGVLRRAAGEEDRRDRRALGSGAALVPTTNPTSTVFFKTIISLKAGNAVVISPHPRAAKCTKAAADLMAQAALQAVAPGRHHPMHRRAHHGIDACADEARAHRRDTGHRRPCHGKAAYSSGKPAFGVGPGNVAGLYRGSAPVAEAVAKVVAGKAFDYGTVCSSEQALVLRGIPQRAGGRPN